MGSRPRTVWQAARRHLTPVADGGLLLPGDSVPTFRTAPLPTGTTIDLWEECGCDYQPSKPARLDPAWARWSEDPTRPGSQNTGKLSLRYALSDPRLKSDGGLLGPNFYQLAHFHSGDARHEAPGYPDFTIWSPRGREVWELKRMGQVPSLPQAVHMTSLHLAGYTVRTVRPCCLLSGWVDRWLAALAGVEPVLSQWAPRPAPTELEAARARRTVRAPSEAVTPRRPALLPQTLPAPGRDLTAAEQASTEPAHGYVIPMPGDDVDQDAWRVGVEALERWLRLHDFTPAAVPWPICFVVVSSLLVVWTNSGEPSPGPGRPRPRVWRAATLDAPVPDVLVDHLGGERITAFNMSDLLGLLQTGRPAATA